MAMVIVNVNVHFQVEKQGVKTEDTQAEEVDEVMNRQSQYTPV